MKSSLLFLLALLAGSVNVLAQNLVPNGSFEEGIECPSFIGNLDEECSHWFSSISYLGSGSNDPNPEWYHVCSDLDFLSPPDVAFGYQEPYDGDGYAGMVVFNNQFGEQESYREPIGVELIQPLIQGHTYLVEFSIVRLYIDPNAISSNNFGFKLTTEPNFQVDSLIINNSATFSIDSMISDTSNWLRISTEILADTNYSYIHFGNFFDNQNTQFVVDGELGIYANIALDAVSVTEVLTTISDKTDPKLDLLIFPNPTKDKITAKSSAELIRYSIYSLDGCLIRSENINNQLILDINVEKLISGPYIINFLTKTSSHYEVIIKM